MIKSLVFFRVLFLYFLGSFKCSWLPHSKCGGQMVCAEQVVVLGWTKEEHQGDMRCLMILAGAVGVLSMGRAGIGYQRPWGALWVWSSM